MSNKSNGTAFERELAQLLSDNGFWVHCLKDNQNGQPFDVIAARDGISYIFDCKDCEGKSFLLSRIEENQHNAMTLWAATGNQPGMFAIRLQRIVYMVPHRMLVIMKENGAKQLSIREANKCGQRLERWLENRNKQNRR